MDHNFVAGSWAAALWSACWQGALFIVLVWAICRCFKRLPASFRAWLWWLAALKLIVGFAWIGGLALPLLPGERSPLADLNHRLDLLAPNVAGKAIAKGVARKDSASGIGQPVAEAETDWLNVGLLLAWGIGIVAISGTVVAQGLKLGGLKKRSLLVANSSSGELARELGAKMGLSRSPTLYSSTEITAPMVTGMLHPAILLPEGIESRLTEEELRLCVAHELAHIRRRDLPLALVPALMQAVYFFFPPAWIVRREWEIEREAACDEEALIITGSAPAGYGRLLLKIVTSDHQGGFATALGATANYHTLKKRINNMKHFAPTPRRMKAGMVGLTALGLLFAVPWRVTARAASIPEQKNAVVNGDFEQGNSGWTEGSLPAGADTGVTFTVDTSAFHGGLASLRIDKSGQSFFPIGEFQQNIPNGSAKRTLNLSVWIKAKDVRKFTVTVGEGRQFSIYVGDKTGTGRATNHDWQQYKASVPLQANETSVPVILEMYGSGTVWVDDMVGNLADGPGAVASEPDPEALKDIADVSNEDTTAAADSKMRYFLVGAKAPEPASGYKLLIVMPGGDGSADFNPFVRRIWKNALPAGYLIAELVAPKWSDDQFNSVVWPTKKQRWQGMKFSTEEFIDSVIKTVGKKHKLDANSIFTLSWSSGGPAAYAAALNLTSIKGSFIAMSVFHPSELPPLFNAKGQAFYLYNSPQDTLIGMAGPQQAADELKKAGAKTTLVTYEGGHGWHGDVFGGIQKGIEWLEANKG